GEQADVAVEALDAVVGDVAGAAMDLHGAVGDPAHHLGGVELAAAGLHGDELAGVAAAGGIQHHGAGGVGLGLAVGEHGLHELEVRDRAAELLALHGIGEAVADQPLGHADADGGDAEPAAVEHLHGGLEALPLLAADQLTGGHAAVLKDDVAGVAAALAHLAVGLAKREA